MQKQNRKPKALFRKVNRRLLIVRFSQKFKRPIADEEKLKQLFAPIIARVVR